MAMDTRRKLSFVEDVNICHLCRNPHVQLTKPSGWKKEEARSFITSLQVPLDAMICKLCRDDIDRALENTMHVPRWIKETRVTKKKCCVVGCTCETESLLVSTKIAHTDIVSAIGKKGMKVSDNITSTQTILCKCHYHMVYYSITHCATCGAYFKSIPGPAWLCPQPDKIQEYLEVSTGFEGSLGKDDYVCNACYKSHLIVLQDLDSEEVTSTDENLMLIISACMEETSTTMMTDEVSTISDVLTFSMKKAIAYVAEQLLNRKAILLTSVHDFFCCFANDLMMSKNMGKPDVPVHELVTPRNILSNLAANLHHHLKYKCTIRKFGTLLYRADEDILPYLTRVLWNLRQSQSNTSTCTNTDCIQEQTESTCTATMKDLNLKIQEQIRDLLKQDAKAPFDHSKFNLDKTISAIDPQIWEAVSLLTQSVSEKRGTSKVRDSSSMACHIKKLRRLFLVSSILFITNDRCSSPLHTLLTDVIDSQGGSSLLIRILNRFGICASTETLDRFIQYKVVQSDQSQSEYMNAEAFTIISADNIDFLHSHARVFQGNQVSSWHGTSVQAVQPLPSLAACDEQICTDADPVLHSDSLMDIVRNGPNNNNDCSDLNSSCGHTLISRKRTQHSSPFPSPQNSTRSPVPKSQRRLRTGTEGLGQSQKSPSHPVVISATQVTQVMLTLKGKQLQDFKMSPEELSAIEEIKFDLNTYMLLRHSIAKVQESRTFLNMQDYFSLTRATHTEKSNVLYLEVMDAKADSKDTIMHMLNNLHEQYITQRRKQWLIVEGDAKVYELLQSVKLEYREELSWLIPYPGDWHTLKNFQHALMKPYFDTGLKALAQSAGYPLAAIQGCSHFKKTHHFLMEAWEATYRSMLATFLTTLVPGQHNQLTGEQLLQSILELMEATLTDQHHNPDCDFSDLFSVALQQLHIHVQATNGSFSKFKDFLKEMADSDDTWKFWIQFVFHDALGYVGLFLAVRSGNWHLRTACMKLMAPVFTVFDHSTYETQISQHLADLLCMPPTILTMFEQGAFVVSICATEWHSVAIDEAHEMLINKECKTSIVRPSRDYINRIAHYIPYRTKALQNLKQQLFPEQVREETIQSPFSSKNSDYKFIQNVQVQMNLIDSHNLFIVCDENRGLLNPFTSKVANKEQFHDLINFRSIGEKELFLRISYFILKNPSVQAPKRRQKLQTFSDRQVHKQRITQAEKDKQLILTAMRNKMQHSKRTGRPIDRPGEQLLTLPMSLCDHEGNPLKGQKSYASRCLETRYKNATPPVFTTEFPASWTPDCCLMEGMLLLSTAPLGSHKTLADYAKFLMSRYLLTHFHSGSIEVHIIFDNPGRLSNTPKYFQQLHMAQITVGHCCNDLSAGTRLEPSKWRKDFINCRVCKCNLIIFLGRYFLNNIGSNLQPDQTLYVAGAFKDNLVDTAWFVKGSNVNSAQPDPTFTSNAEGTDTRLWLHARQTTFPRILVISADMCTDVYHIGLPLCCTKQKEIIVQVNQVSSRQLKLLHLTGLLQALENDPDLAHIDQTILPQILQTIYITTGCDSISFFSKIGKATFFRYFFQYASFITSGEGETCGTLADTSLNDTSLGFMAFMRLVGTVYFKKHASGFDVTSPATHFLKFIDPSCTPIQHHSAWLEDIRQNIWHRIRFENEMIPSDESLLQHWQRTCWVSHMWLQADCNNIVLQPVTEFGWKVVDNTLTVVWDSNENMAMIQERVSQLLNGCKCKTGCKTRRCSCRKSNRNCGEGCECSNCCNVNVNTSTSHECEMEEEMAEIALDEIDEEESDIEDLMIQIFGGDDDTDIDELEPDSENRDCCSEMEM